MRPLTTIALIPVGLTGLTQIVLGAFLWTGHSLTLIPLHMQVGYAFVVLLWTLTVLAVRDGASSSLAGLTFVWGVIVVVSGILRDRLLPGDAHWMMNTLHLLIGLTALVLARMLVARIPRARAPSLGSSRRGAA
jgi:hypothetical protein